eukprot:690534-Rhodomonas_salina.2
MCLAAPVAGIHFTDTCTWPTRESVPRELYWLELTRAGPSPSSASTALRPGHSPAHVRTTASRARRTIEGLVPACVVAVAGPIANALPARLVVPFAASVLTGVVYGQGEFDSDLGQRAGLSWRGLRGRFRPGRADRTGRWRPLHRGRTPVAHSSDA